MIPDDLAEETVAAESGSEDQSKGGQSGTGRSQICRNRRAKRFFSEAYSTSIDSQDLSDDEDPTSDIDNVDLDQNDLASFE